MVFFGKDGDWVYCGSIRSYEEYFSIVNDPFGYDTWFLKDSALWDDGGSGYFIVCPD
jgi:hypothetical protein